MKSIEMSQLAKVTGGAAAKAAVKAIKSGARLIGRRVGRVKVFNNQTEQQMWDELKPQ